MLAIKFRRQGKKHQASYRVVVAEKRSKMRGRFVDDLGWFDPHSKKFDLKKEKVEHWIKVGAKPTDSVHNLLVRAEVIKDPKIAVHSTKKKKKKEEHAADEAKTGKEKVKAEPVAEVKEEVASTPVKENKEEVKPEEKKKEKSEEKESEPEQKTETEIKEKKESASSADKGEEKNKKG